QLYAFNISNATDPQLINKKDIGWNIETIYPFSDKLFIGSATGMFIYNISDAANPLPLGQFSHVRSCDPVIADDKHAYVTLRSGTTCQGFSNKLDVLSIDNVTKPNLVKTYPMTNPHGLSKDEDLLFICDGRDGLKVYDAKDANNVKLITIIPGMDTYDVITDNNIAIVVAKDGLYQFDYSDRNSIRQISKISLSK
ncbi:MAG: hypothetical protein ICV66_07445, partial [Chitinophagaceae bacterium]|nr:hypothetical protein [Chitinophagaceae bacterium]